MQNTVTAGTVFTETFHFENGDAHAFVGNNTERSCVPFTQFPPMVESCKTTILTLTQSFLLLLMCVFNPIVGSCFYHHIQNTEQPIPTGVPHVALTPHPGLSSWQSGLSSSSLSLCHFRNVIYNRYWPLFTTQEPKKLHSSVS